MSLYKNTDRYTILESCANINLSVIPSFEETKRLIETTRKDSPNRRLFFYYKEEGKLKTFDFGKNKVIDNPSWAWLLVPKGTKIKSLPKS